MAQKTHKKAGPPTYIAPIIQALTPRAFRAPLSLQLFTTYTTLPNYFFDAAGGIGRATAIQSVEAFNKFRLLGDLCCVYIALQQKMPDDGESALGR